MQPVDTSSPGSATPAALGPARLRLYIARFTPNSLRAEHNLSAVLYALRGAPAAPILEVIDVFAEPKRAIIDGVVVTPTLIVLGSTKRIVLMGDLADQAHVRQLIENAAGPPSADGLCRPSTG